MDDRRKLELAGWALAAVVMVLLGARLWRQGGADRPPATAAVSVGTRHAPAPKRGRFLVVDVEGEVRRPGVQRVPAGSRVDVAVARAGGLTRRGDAAGVNLAAPLHDGQQLVVPRRGAAGAAAAADPATAAGGAGAPGAPPA